MSVCDASGLAVKHESALAAPAASEFTFQAFDFDIIETENKGDAVLVSSASNVGKGSSSSESHTEGQEGEVSSNMLLQAAHEMCQMHVVRCIACELPRVPGFRWCRSHKCCADSLSRDILSKRKSSDPDVRKAAQAEKLAHDKAMAQDDTAAMKILIFEKNHPEAIRGKKRGAFDHIGFSERYCKSTWSSDQRWGRWMDFVEFSEFMKKRRSWTVGQAKQRWDKMKAAGKEVRNDGPEPDWPERMLISKGDYSIAGVTSAEEHAMELVSKKFKGMDNSQFTEVMANLGRGHLSTNAAFLSNPMFSGSCHGEANMQATQTFAAPALPGLGANMLEDAGAAQKRLEALQVAKDAKDGLDVGRAASGEEHPPGQDKPVELAAVDKLTQCLPAHQKWERQATADREKAIASLKGIYGQMQNTPEGQQDTEEYKLLRRRLDFCTSLYNVEFKTNVVGDATAVEHRDRYPFDNKGLQSSLQHFKSASENIPETERPFPDFDKLHPWSQVVATCDTMRSARTEKARNHDSCFDL